MSVTVSITCLTYNHEKYISKTLDSFLAQKTDFEFEVLIHDDASTDRTSTIIQKYQKMYPNIIKPIIQTTNQYSLGNPVSLFNYERAQGKYIAICEGDDYWIDDNKLQKQFNIMEANPTLSGTFHAAYRINETNKNKFLKISPFMNEKILSTKDLLNIEGKFFATNSIFLKTKDLLPLPQFYNVAPIGDFPLLLHLSLKGNILYTNELMSVYRVAFQGSFTDKYLNNKETLTKYHLKMIKMYEEFDISTNKAFYDNIEIRIFRHKIELAAKTRTKNIYYELKKNRLYKKISFKKKLKVFIYFHFPKIAKMLDNLVKKIV